MIGKERDRKCRIQKERLDRGTESWWNTTARTGACDHGSSEHNYLLFKSFSVTAGGRRTLKLERQALTFKLKREQERPLKFAQASLSTISLFLPLASGHLSAFWKDVKKFNHHREWERGRERVLTTFSFSVSLYFALSLLSTQSTESSPAVFLCVVYWGKWMGYTNRAQLKRN